jgi:hypothetical protein
MAQGGWLVRAKKLRLTGLHALRPSASGVPFAQVVPLRSTPTAHSTHSLSALKMLRIFLFGPPNRRKQPERYVPFLQKILPKLYKNIDT